MPDPELLLLILTISAISALAVYFVSIFGVKEKSFEEAIAEQKKRSEELLGKDFRKKDKKQKEKKEKKNRKEKFEENFEEKLEEKIEEKLEIKLEEKLEEKKHIHIVEQPELIENEQPTRKLSITTPTKKSILKHNDTAPPSPPPTTTPPSPTPPENHFLTIHPKDMIELKKHPTPSMVKKPQKATPLSVILSTLQTTPLSPPEIQTLIDTLLHNNNSTNWLPSQPTQKENLKKQLEVKEQKVIELETNLQTLQNKIREIRGEFAAEKGKLLQGKKVAEEALLQGRLELEQVKGQIRLHHQKESELAKTCTLLSLKCKDLSDELERARTDTLRHEGDWRGKYEIVEREAGALKAQYDKQATQLSSAFASNEHLTQQLTQLQQKLATQNEQLASLHHQNNLLLQENKSQKEQFSAQEAENLGKIAQLSGELAQARVKIDELQRNGENLKKVVEQFNQEETRRRIKEEDEKKTLEEDQRKEEEKWRLKNDELRQKNTALLSSLQQTEKELQLKQTQITEQEKNLEKIVSQFGVNFENWPAEIAQKLANSSQTTSQEVEKLRDEVVHYQSVLERTESLLATLQKSIETEEKKWLAKLSEKERLLSELKEQLKEENLEETCNNNSSSSPDAATEKKKKKKVLGFFTK